MVGLIPWAWHWTADTWAAIGQIGTLVVAGVAVRFARGQVLEARRSREDQARPFVIVDFEPSRVGRIFMDLVIRNIGSTIATNVHVTFEPPLVSTLSTAPDKSFHADSALLRSGIPTLPPRREHRMLFERMPSLKENESMPRTYTATVIYDDARGQQQTLVNLLDLNIYFGMRQIGVDGLHEAVAQLKSINHVISAWAQQSRDDPSLDDDARGCSFCASERSLVRRLRHRILRKFRARS